MEGRLYSINEIAREEGVYWETVSDLVSRHNIPIKKHPNNGKAKAIDGVGYAKIRRLLNSPKTAVVASA